MKKPKKLEHKTASFGIPKNVDLSILDLLLSDASVEEIIQSCNEPIIEKLL